jgi:hypothetical protein
MPEAIKAALTTPLSLSLDHSHSEVPQELQYMPPGTHRINASRAGKPVALDITADASTPSTRTSLCKAPNRLLFLLPTFFLLSRDGCYI